MSCSTNKLINSAASCVEDSLVGIAAAHPGLSVNTTAKIVMRLQEQENCRKYVGIVSGGGSGHEPFSTGFVGQGMLSAAVAGNIFTSPPASNCLTAIENVAEHNKGGVLVLIPNYTGDVLNFGLAVEIAKDMGYNVESITVGEDCALLGHNSEESITGRRGLCGQLFVFKIAGALASKGESLSVIVDSCKDVIASMATLGVCTSPCSLPGSSNPLFHLSAQNMELGLGIHGEAGVAKIDFCSASEAASVMLKKIVNTMSLVSGDEVCAIVNSLGSSTTMECYILAGELKKQLCAIGISVARIYVGALVTSLEMGGIQFCLLRTTDRPDWLELLDADTEAPAWPGRPLSFLMHSTKIQGRAPASKKLTGPELNSDQVQVVRRCLMAVADSLIAAEEHLNELDSGCGDGDCGSTLRRLADEIHRNISKLPLHRPVTCFMELADIASETMGGTSGGIYSLLLRGAARYVPDWEEAWQGALDTITKYSRAKVGHRTMMDALFPACETFKQNFPIDGWQSALKSAVEKAEEGCEKTRNMDALCGRASYVQKSYLKNVDAGAFAVTLWLRAVYTELINYNEQI